MPNREWESIQICLVVHNCEKWAFAKQRIFLRHCAKLQAIFFRKSFFIEDFLPQLYYYSADIFFQLHTSNKIKDLIQDHKFSKSKSSKFETNKTIQNLSNYARIFRWVQDRLFFCAHSGFGQSSYFCPNPIISF